MASLEPKRERASIPETMENMLKRFDFLSAGTGALVVTGYCWSRGQDPLHALSLTLTATVVAVVLNELLFNNDSSLAASEQEHSIREGAAVFITAHVQGIRASGDIKPLAEHQHTCWPAIKSSSRFSSANGDRTKYIMDSRGGIGWVVRSADWCVHVMQTMLSVLCTGAAAKGSMRLTLRVLYNIEQAMSMVALLVVRSPAVLHAMTTKHTACLGRGPRAGPSVVYDLPVVNLVVEVFVCMIS
eukprot:CAMPEP_0202865250 /NCGR_PEP_ID=MMETSP1391-20130828/5452_1 /ASSEMBLY_ACC=CAM_ASM_000867 /TAXON_ID=1034604 /ORGANISM="Chlamydomonas leiostraca, Strain SAG 11-49" /LENGTH=242 /DNA_ID=CAMNT_0049545061 /DNA_START=178 /DNA_END=908 /DNA_ORIENTATION=+